MVMSTTLTSIFSCSSVVTIGLDSMMYSLMEGESETTVVSVMTNDVTLERDVLVTVVTADGTATAASGIYMYTHVHVQFCATLYILLLYVQYFFLSFLLLSVFLFRYFHTLVCYTHFPMYVHYMWCSSAFRVCVAVVLCTLFMHVCTCTCNNKTTVVHVCLPLHAHISTDDYDELSEVLTFNSGSLSQNVMVTTLPDRVADEGDEVFSLSLTGDVAVQFSVFSATVTITDASECVQNMGYPLLFSPSP